MSEEKNLEAAKRWGARLLVPAIVAAPATAILGSAAAQAGTATTTFNYSTAAGPNSCRITAHNWKDSGRVFANGTVDCDRPTQISMSVVLWRDGSPVASTDVGCLSPTTTCKSSNISAADPSGQQVYEAQNVSSFELNFYSDSALAPDFF